MWSALRNGFPSSACKVLNVFDFLRIVARTSLPSSPPVLAPVPIQRPYWEGSGVYGDAEGALGAGAAAQCAGISDCCFALALDGGALTGRWQSCASAPSQHMCFKQRGEGRKVGVEELE